jgi:type IV fimbrial biogenesis protein FimT
VSKLSKLAQRGATLLELMVTLMVAAILMATGLPAMSDWIKRSSVGTAAELIQNALRQAETEAIRRNAEVEFALTDDTPAASAVNTITAKDNGKNWLIRVVDTTASNRYVNGNMTKQLSDGLSYQGPASIRFNGSGRVLDSTGAAVSAKQVFRVSRSGIDLAYCVFVTPGGGVKMCNPAFPSGNVRACQPILTAAECP